ncbi:MAG: universal stress protein [Candidatus Methanoplasma sp.]|jgi:nucleotide-binding universal stress UspA family protein|nr:universal stress protein [Candidatus Methanoplasma sp.]
MTEYNFKKILIATDGSEFTKAAVEHGLSLAKLSGGSVTALYVLDQSVYSNTPASSAVVNIYETLSKEGNYATGYIAERGRELGIEVKEEIAEGVPSKVISRLSEDFDIIVMGTLGRTGISKLLMGSVAEKVIKESKCPVMVVRSSGQKKQ